MTTHRDLVRRAQAILTDYLTHGVEPGRPFCPIQQDTLTKLLELLDGPESRAVDEFRTGLERLQMFDGMTLNEFQAAASRTLPERAEQHWFESLPHDARNVDLIHAVFGITGEAGELVDPVKKAMFYGKPLDVENIKEEAGDLLWYIAGPLCRALGCTLEELAAANVAKLRSRYEKGYSDAAAVARADKAEPQGEDGPWAEGWQERSKPGAPFDETLPDPEDREPFHIPEWEAKRPGYRLRKMTKGEAKAILSKYDAGDVNEGYYFSPDEHSWYPIEDLWERMPAPVNHETAANKR